MQQKQRTWHQQWWHDISGAQWGLIVDDSWVYQIWPSLCVIFDLFIFWRGFPPSILLGFVISPKLCFVDSGGLYYSGIATKTCSTPIWAFDASWQRRFDDWFCNLRMCSVCCFPNSLGRDIPPVILAAQMGLAIQLVANDPLWELANDRW